MGWNCPYGWVHVLILTQGLAEPLLVTRSNSASHFDSLIFIHILLYLPPLSPSNVATGCG